MSAIYTSAEITGLDGSSVFVEESLDNEFYQYPTLKRYIVSIKREGRQIATVQLDLVGLRALTAALQDAAGGLLGVATKDNR